ncbi:unnamed protein product [Sphagnum tenellum]
MPVVAKSPGPTPELEERQARRRQHVQQILAKSLRDDEECSSAAAAAAVLTDDVAALLLVEADVARQKETSLQEYRRMVTATLDTPLSKLAMSAAGCELFEELCLRIDVNQQYASCLPQWKDVAELLEVDALRTQWVGVCVRPVEGLTRAVLEIYMRDGGTLGEVLQALLQLECLEILERVKPRVWQFVREKDSTEVAATMKDEKFFSILSTLVAVFGKNDPCSLLQNYSKGLCNAGVSNLQQLSSPLIHDILVRSSGGVEGVTCDPNPDLFQATYQSKSHSKSQWDKDQKATEKCHCRILLLFAEDGIEAADKVCNRYQGFTFEVRRSNTVKYYLRDVEVEPYTFLSQGRTAEFFRLNEASLWYEVLVNPEACCMKWVNEADYVMPILTPKLLTEIHVGGINEAGLLPTSPSINRFMYTLLRARYTEAGCRNTMIRPIIPEEHLAKVGQASAVKLDPLFRSAWVSLEETRLQKRLQGMLSNTP